MQKCTKKAKIQEEGKLSPQAEEVNPTTWKSDVKKTINRNTPRFLYKSKVNYLALPFSAPTKGHYKPHYPHVALGYTTTLPFWAVIYGLLR
jgi:hypothetical protein